LPSAVAAPPASTPVPASAPSMSVKPSLPASSKVNADIGIDSAANTMGPDRQIKASDGSMLGRRAASPQDEIPAVEDYYPDYNDAMLPVDNPQDATSIPIPSPPPGPPGGALKAQPIPIYQAITVLGDTYAADQAARMPPGNCPETIVPIHYTPILQLPAEVAKLNKDYELCQVDRALEAVFHPILGTQIKLPEKTKWGVKVPPLPKTSTVEMESIVRWMRPEAAEETGSPSAIASERTVAAATAMTAVE